MDSLNDMQLPKYHKEEEPMLLAMQLSMSSFLPMALKTAIELDLFEIIAKSKNSQPLSVSEIVSQLPTKNPNAPFLIERILWFLASNSILECNIVTDEDGNSRRRYFLAPVCRYLTKNEDGVSVAPYLVYIQSKQVTECWHYLKEAVLEGGTPANMVFGRNNFFDYKEKADTEFNEVMFNLTSMVMKKILETYNGFESLKEVVDVGGGFGANLGLIVSKYPHIKGINFDLPLVIKDAPTIQGVHHVGGDMFTDVPKGEAIFLKCILHDWDDDKCSKILKNCRNALPTNGKVIVVEQIASEFPETDIVSKIVSEFDMVTLIILPGAKERTKKEFETLAKNSGFEAVKFVCQAYGYWVIELYK